MAKTLFIKFLLGPAAFRIQHGHIPPEPVPAPALFPVNKDRVFPGVVLGFKPGLLAPGVDRPFAALPAYRGRIPGEKSIKVFLADGAPRGVCIYYLRAAMFVLHPNKLWHQSENLGVRPALHPPRTGLPPFLSGTGNGKVYC